MMALRGLTLFFHVSWLGSCCLHPSPFHKIIWRQWPLLTLLGCWNSCEHRHATLISIYQHYHPPPTFTLPLMPCWCSLISGDSLYNVLKIISSLTDHWWMLAWHCLGHYWAVSWDHSTLSVSVCISDHELSLLTPVDGATVWSSR